MNYETMSFAWDHGRTPREESKSTGARRDLRKTGKRGSLVWISMFAGKDHHWAGIQTVGFGLGC